MQYGMIQGVSLPVSRIVFGTAIPALFAATRADCGGEPGFDAALDKAFGILDDMLELGITTFDCSTKYGEEPLGEWMKRRGNREKIVILTKGAHHNDWRKRVTPYDILSDAHDSLAKLGTDFIDIYILHRDDPEVPVGPIVETLNQLHDEGKIGIFGGSNWTPRRIEAANEYAARRGLIPFTVSSPYFGLAEQVNDPWGGDCQSIAGPAHANDRAWYAKNKMPIFAYSTMARGFFGGRFTSEHPEDAKKWMDEPGLTGYFCPENIERLKRAEALAREKNVTAAQIAMAWLFSQNEIDAYALVGTASKAHMQANIQGMETKLTSAQCRYLNLED